LGQVWNAIPGHPGARVSRLISNEPDGQGLVTGWMGEDRMGRMAQPSVVGVDRLGELGEPSG
jgi:hypothetical protein